MRDEPLEKQIEKEIRREMDRLGWHTEKIHGGRFQSGLPDLHCFHRVHGYRWVEVKRPKSGRLTNHQMVKFPVLDASGQGIWILTSADQIDLLFKDPNWKLWLPKRDKAKELSDLLGALSR